MRMSCHSIGGGGSKKRKIAIISGAGAGVAGITYLSLTANPGAAAAIPAVLLFAACPAMCAAMSGVMWLSRRFKKRNNIMLSQTSKNNVNEQLESENHKVESGSDDGDDGKEVVQLQYHQNLRKRRARQKNDGVEDATST